MDTMRIVCDIVSVPRVLSRYGAIGIDVIISIIDCIDSTAYVV